MWTFKDKGWITVGFSVKCYYRDTADTLKCSLPRNMTNTVGFHTNGCGPCPKEDANIVVEINNNDCITTGPEKHDGKNIPDSFFVLVFVYKTDHLSSL